MVRKRRNTSCRKAAEMLRLDRIFSERRAAESISWDFATVFVFGDELRTRGDAGVSNFVNFSVKSKKVSSHFSWYTLV